MKISPKTNLKKVITVHEQVGRALLKQGRFVLAEPKTKVEAPLVVADSQRSERFQVEEPDVEISPRTGLPKRQYRRRDMEAE